jgi:uncharacterized protein YcaQ
MAGTPAVTTTLRRDLLAELVEAGELTPVAIEGVRDVRHVVTGELAWLDAAEREVRAEPTDAGLAASPEASLAAGPGAVGQPGVAFLAPLDPLVWDRVFLRSLYDFDYVWEVYVPEARRRWGYYVLPILYGDRLVGRIEPRLERGSGTLKVVGLWWEADFDPLETVGFAAAFAAALDAHRQFGAVERIVLPRAVRHRPFVAAVRAILATIGGGAR